MLTEADIRLEINKALENKGWKLQGSKKNVFAEQYARPGYADYELKPQSWQNPLIIIEAKKRGEDLNSALEQAKKYAQVRQAPIIYATDGNVIKTLHLSNLKPLILNGEEVDEFLPEELALNFQHNHEYNSLDRRIIESRRELIQVFAAANKELRKEGLQAGIERFSEFCNILFLKLFSEQETIKERDKRSAPNKLIKKEYRWDYFKNLEGEELLHYVNERVLNYFQEKYGQDIFSPLQLKNPATLKRIIEKLDNLSLTDINSDIKGDAFEYFLKAYLSKQQKDLGEYFTPRHIVKFLVKLTNPKFGEKVYDPFCGTGGILIEAFRHIYQKMPRESKKLQILKSNTIYGGEITQTARITKMNMILSGDGHNNIKRQDSLKNPVWNKYDVVITNMPFSLGNYAEYSAFYLLGSANGNSLCIEHCLTALNKDYADGRIAIIVPEGILFDRKFSKLREHIYQNSYVENIISLPAGTFVPYSNVKTSILYLTKRNIFSKAEQKVVWHYEVKNDGYTLNTKREKKEGTNDLDIFLSFRDSSEEEKLKQAGFSKLNLELVSQNNYISIPNVYKKFTFDSKYEIVALGELVEEVIIRNDDNSPIWSVTKESGFVVQKEKFAERIASEDITNYKIVPPNHFAYRPPGVNVGYVCFNERQEKGCVSPYYSVFKVKNNHWFTRSNS